MRAMQFQSEPGVLRLMAAQLLEGFSNFVQLNESMKQSA